MGIKGEMSGTVCVTFTWDMCIYIWVVNSLCFFCCLFITVTWWYVWYFEWASGNQEEVQACLVTLWLFIISCYSLYKTTHREITPTAISGPRFHAPQHIPPPPTHTHTHLLALHGVRHTPDGEGALAGGTLCYFANIGPRNSIQVLIRYVLEMPILMSVSRSMQVFSKFYFRDTPEQDQGALRTIGSGWPN